MNLPKKILMLNLCLVLLILVLRGRAVLSYAWSNVGMLTLNKALSATTDTASAQAIIPAETKLRQAVKWHQDNQSAHKGLGWVLAALGQEEAASSEWRKGGFRAQDFIARGEPARRAGQYREALIWFERAVMVDQESVDGWYHKGLAYAGMAQWDDALRMYGQAAALDPTDPQPYYATGNIFLYKDPDHGKALEAYRMAAAIDPLPVQAYVGMATALEHLDRKDEAFQAYEEAVSLSYQVQGASEEELRDRVWPHYVLGDFLLRQGRLEDATRSFKEALALDPEHTWADWSQWGLGLIALQQERYNEAETFFSQALELTTTPYVRSQAHLGLGRLYLEQGNVEQGVDHLRKARDENPENQGLHRYLADTLREVGRYSDAVLEYERYLERWPQDGNVIQSLQETQRLLESQQP